MAILFIIISCAIVLLTLKYSECWAEREGLKSMVELQSRYIAIYQAELRKTENSNIVPREIQDAVKYAMVHSHPDNGGSAAEFDKYRKLYNKIKES